MLKFNSLTIVADLLHANSLTYYCLLSTLFDKTICTLVNFTHYNLELTTNVVLVFSIKLIKTKMNLPENYLRSMMLMQPSC